MRLPIALDYRPALLSSAGIGRATRELARALAARTDVAVHLFAHSLARTANTVAVPPGAALHRLPIPGRCVPLLARLGLGADRLAGGAKVFHWTDYVMPPVSRARVVLTVHDLAFAHDAAWHGANTKVLAERTRAAIAAAAAVIVPSRSTAADLREFEPRARAVHVVPFGSDHVPASAPPPPAPVAGREYALCVGTIEPRKNHAALLAAWRRLPAPRPLLVVVGRRGWECDSIVRDLQAAVDAGDAVWLENAGDGVLWSLLAHARLLVYPSAWEGFGFPPLEAMALGVPVVANDIAPLRELGEGAFVLAAANDPDALRGAVQRALRDPQLRAHCIGEGRQRAAAFRWEDCAAAHAAIYREVAAC